MSSSPFSGDEGDDGDDEGAADHGGLLAGDRFAWGLIFEERIEPWSSPSAGPPADDGNLAA